MADHGATEGLGGDHGFKISQRKKKKGGGGGKKKKEGGGLTYSEQHRLARSGALIRLRAASRLRTGPAPDDPRPHLARSPRRN